MFPGQVGLPEQKAFKKQKRPLCYCNSCQLRLWRGVSPPYFVPCGHAWLLTAANRCTPRPIWKVALIWSGLPGSNWRHPAYILDRLRPVSRHVHATKLRHESHCAHAAGVTSPRPARLRQRHEFMSQLRHFYSAVVFCSPFGPCSECLF